MLLENPKARFDASKLDNLRYFARTKLKQKLKPAHYWRDEGYGSYGLRERKVGREIADLKIKQSFRLGRTDIRLANSILRAANQTGVGFDSLVRIYDKHFGFDVRQAVIDNHKTSWVEPVWANERWFKESPYCFFHDVHVSEDDPSQIAYNRSVDGIKRNIQTRTKPGKYLTQFFSDALDQDEIREWAQKQIAYATCTGELKFVDNDDEDGWIDVYNRGPGSCMRGSKAVRVYAYPGNGLRLAYIESGEAIVARCIVVDATNDDEVKGWLRIYATDQRWETAMLEMLRAAGYDTRTNLNGIKLQLIEGNYGEYQCPYIDYGSGGEQMVDPYPNSARPYLLVGHGDIEATNTGGWVSLGEECDSCGEYGGDMTYIESTEENVCEHCRDEHYTYAYGYRHQDYFPNDDVVYCETDGEYYHQDHYGNHDIVYLDDRNEYRHIDDCVCVNVGDHEGEWLHADDVSQDHISGEYDRDDRFETINGNSVHESYVVTDHVTGEMVDMRECVQIFIGRKHRYLYSDYYKMDVNVYIHQDNLTADVILSEFVKCGDNLYTSDFYGNPVTCFEPDNVIYGDEYTGDKIEDHLVADAEERLAA